MRIKLKCISKCGFGLKYPVFLWLLDMMWTPLKGATWMHFQIPLFPAWWTGEAKGVWRTGGRISVYLTDLFFSRAQKKLCHDLQFCASLLWSKRCPHISVKVFYLMDDSVKRWKPIREGGPSLPIATSLVAILYE